jgi:PAS domain S-box-containing protein
MYEEDMSPFSVNMTIPDTHAITLEHSTMSPYAGVAAPHEGAARQRGPLSVLYVDDEPAFLDLCKIYLELSGEISMTGTTSAYHALEMLEKSRFDVIVSDYQMPEMDGIGLLKLLQTKKYNTPFILFTGRGREEVVIQAINNGATFYLQKGGDPKSLFAELGHKIKEAARRRQAEEALKESENRYRTVFENSGTAMVITEEDTTILLSNAEFSRLTGYTNDELDGKMRWTEFAVKQDLDWMLAQHRLRRKQREKAAKSYESRLVTKSGGIRNILITIELIPGTMQSVASLIDITVRKQAEEELMEKNEELALAYDQLAAAEETLRHKFNERSHTRKHAATHKMTASNWT